MKLLPLLSLFIALLCGCSTPNIDQEINPDEIKVNLSLGKNYTTKAATAIDSLPLSVNRILIIPFQKLDTAQPNSNTNNFIPTWNFAHQYDINTFPANSLKLGLPKSFTYKVLILGYNRNDYDYYNPSVAGSRFDIKSQLTPTTWTNFRVYPKTASDIPEFFTCFCQARVNDTTIGEVFTPSSGTDITLSGNLKRIVSGLDVLINNVPAYVTSISLSADHLVKAIQLVDTTATLVQTAGDGENRIIRTLVPQARTVRFNTFLLPTKTTNKTLLYLNVSYDTRNTIYTIKVPDSQVSAANQIILRPNGAVKIIGNFTQTGISFEVVNNIQLDDNQWDGLQ